MLAAITLVALALVPAEQSAGALHARCESCAFVAQLDPPPPPEIPPPPTVSDRELNQRVLALNHEIRSIDVNWPGTMIALMYGGYLLTAAGIDLGILGLLEVGMPFLMAYVGAAMVVVGVTIAIIAWTRGNSLSTERRATREKLIREREVLEEELRFRRSERQQGSPTVSAEPRRPLITIAEF